MSVEVAEAPTPTWARTVRMGGAWVLLASCLVLTVASIVAGRGDVSYADLLAAVLDRKIDSILPSWARFPVFLITVGLFALLVVGPQPWRATRWAWFWLLAVAPPLGVFAFLLLGGGTGLWRPAQVEKRLTGGPAFALVILVGLALSGVEAAFL